MTGHLPAQGELSPETVRAALGLAPLERQRPPTSPWPTGRPSCASAAPTPTPSRPSRRPWRTSPARSSSRDIGCYTLGYFPPHKRHRLLRLHGRQRRHGPRRVPRPASIPAIGVIGDSTFGHSGMTALLSAATADADMVLVILDNGTVAMTGTQPSFSTGERLLDIVRGVGVAPERHPGHHPAAQVPRGQRQGLPGGDRPPRPVRGRGRAGVPGRGQEEEQVRRRPVSDTRKQDIILAGVGGQGILSIAFVIDSAALKEGLHVKQAEVHGMAQRGGAVTSHLRLSSRQDLERPHPPGRGRPDPERRAAGGPAVPGLPQARGPDRDQLAPRSSTSPTTRTRTPC